MNKMIDNYAKKIAELAIENAELRDRNEELEKYHGFYMGKPIPEGDDTLSEINQLRDDLAEEIRSTERLHNYIEKLETDLAEAIRVIEKSSKELINVPIPLGSPININDALSSCTAFLKRMKEGK
jgi:DNA repair exonuclease SbcCD ATPase subunit